MHDLTLTQVGESKLIDYIQARFCRTDSTEISIGDDAAVFSHSERVVATADTMVETIHFERDMGTAEDLGYKLVAVNVSDIAAMGATPTKALFSFSAPGSLQWSWVRSLIDGISDAAQQFDLEVVGGDVTGSPGPVTLSLTLLGRLMGATPLCRDAARPGETLYVTGSLGAAALGLNALRSGAPTPALVPQSIHSFLRPMPRLIEAQALVESGQCRCAMDLSDGLLVDAERLAKASGLDIEIELASLPLPSECRSQDARDFAFAISGGEDYELLFTFRGEPPIVATAIGTVQPGRGELRFLLHGKVVQVEGGGYRHF